MHGMMMNGSAFQQVEACWAERRSALTAPLLKDSPLRAAPHELSLFCSWSLVTFAKLMKMILIIWRPTLVQLCMRRYRSALSRWPPTKNMRGEYDRSVPKRLFNCWGTVWLECFISSCNKTLKSICTNERAHAGSELRLTDCLLPSDACSLQRKSWENACRGTNAIVTMMCELPLSRISCDGRDW